MTHEKCFPPTPGDYWHCSRTQVEMSDINHRMDTPRVLEHHAEQGRQKGSVACVTHWVSPGCRRRTNVANVHRLSKGRFAATDVLRSRQVPWIRDDPYQTPVMLLGREAAHAKCTSLRHTDTCCLHLVTLFLPNKNAEQCCCVGRGRRLPAPT